jgi:hypothetical protein
VTVDRGAGLVDPVTIHSGERSQRIPSGATEGTVRAPPSPAFGDRTVLARAAVGGDPVALLQTNTTIENPVDAAVDVTVADDGEQTVSLTIDNNARRESTVTDVEWVVGEQRGTLEVGTTLAAGGSTTVELPVDRVEPWARHAVDVTVGLADRDPVSITREVGINPIPRRSTTVDGDVSEHRGSSHISLSEHTAMNIDDANYEGPSDLSGDVWLAWNEGGLTVAASIVDDNHTADFDPGTVWKGDSIQLGVSTTPPGSESAFYAYNIGETTQGDVAFRGAAIAEMPTRQVAENVDVSVVRDEEGDRTYYEATIPWSALQPADSEGPFALSLLVNDNDGEGREGFLEWAGGIGSGKDTAQYRTVVPVESAALDGVETPAPSTAAGTTTPGEATASATERATPTPDGQSATEPTPDAATDSPGDTRTDPADDADTTGTPADGPGLGVVVAMAVLFGSGFVARRW